MPVVFIEAPPGLRPDAKRRLVEKVTAAIAEAYPIVGHVDLSARVSGGEGGHGWAATVGESPRFARP